MLAAEINLGIFCVRDDRYLMKYVIVNLAIQGARDLHSDFWYDSEIASLFH